MKPKHEALSDVARVRSAAAERARTSAVGHGGGIADNALEGDLALKLVDAGGLTLGLIGGEGVEDLLGLGGGVGVDRGGVESAIVVDAINCPEDVAAALLLVSLGCRNVHGDVVDIADDLVADALSRGDGKRGRSVDGVQDVAVLVLQVSEVEAVVDVFRSRRAIA